MNTVELHGILRETSGKSGVRQIRHGGRTPGILYGKGEESVAFSFDAQEFEGVLRKHGGGTFVIDLKIDGQEDRDLKAIIKELQRDPVTSKILHVDLQHVSMTQIVHVQVPIHLTGTAAGVKEGGILDQLCREISVECQTAKIPADVKVDVTELMKGQSLHVSDIALPEGVRSLTAGDRVIASVIAKAVEVKEVEVEAEEEAAKEEAAKEEGEAPAEPEGKESSS
jgi:large subunit ribosomal protein L25